MAVALALIGAGDWGSRHAQIVAQHPHARLAWVCDRDISRAEAVARACGGQATTDVDKVLEDPAVCGVIVATPESYHHEHAMRALEAGKHVLVEKPVSLDPEEISDLMECCRRTQRFVLPGHVLRFMPTYAKLIQDVRSGAFGRPVAIYARRNVPRERLKAHNRIHPVMMALIHDIDLILACVGEIPQRVVAMDAQTAPDLVNPDVFWGILRFPGGSLAALESLWTLPSSSRYVDAVLEVHTEKALLRVRYPSDGVYAETAEGYELGDPQILWNVDGKWVGGLAEEVDYFVRCIEQQSAPTLVTLEDALKAVRVARQLIEAAESERVPGY